MTRMDQIQEFLRQHRGQAYCDDCLSKVLNIRPRQQVEQKTKKLEAVPGFDRRVRLCAACKDTNKLAVSASAFARVIA